MVNTKNNVTTEAPVPRLNTNSLRQVAKRVSTNSKGSLALASKNAHAAVSEDQGKDFIEFANKYLSKDEQEIFVSHIKNGTKKPQIHIYLEDHLDFLILHKESQVTIKTEKYANNFHIIINTLVAMEDAPKLLFRNIPDENDEHEEDEKAYKYGYIAIHIPSEDKVKNAKKICRMLATLCLALKYINIEDIKSVRDISVHDIDEDNHPGNMNMDMTLIEALNYFDNIANQTGGKQKKPVKPKVKAPVKPKVKAPVKPKVKVPVKPKVK